MSPNNAVSPENPVFRKVSETEAYRGAMIQVATGEFEGPGGERFVRDVVRHPGAVVVVPVTAADRVVMVRQYRAAVDAEILEIPAGKRDVAGEATELTAERELAEEVGLRAGRMDLLARFYNSPGFTDELTWLYLARDLEAVPADRQGVEEQNMTIEEIDLRDFHSLVESGDIVDAKSLIGIALAIERMAAGR